MSTPLVHSDVPDELNRLSFAVIGCAIEVHRALGPGQPERFYEAALCVALRKRGLAFERQKRIEVAFEGESIGTAVIDLVVEGRLIVEIKSVEEFHRSHEAQLRGYLRLTRLRLGLLVNFGEPVLRDGVRRVLGPAT